VQGARREPAPFVAGKLDTSFVYLPFTFAAACGRSSDCAVSAKTVFAAPPVIKNQLSAHLRWRGSFAADKPEQCVETGFFASGAVQ
jgi:hypothetical protein